MAKIVAEIPATLYRNFCVFVKFFVTMQSHTAKARIGALCTNTGGIALIILTALVFAVDLGFKPFTDEVFAVA